MTDKTQAAMNYLLANVESNQTDGTGTWGSVYVDNARGDAEKAGMGIRTFNGCLSILKREGHYRPCEDASLSEAKRIAFGYVKTDEAKAKAKRKRRAGKRTSRTVGS